MRTNVTFRYPAEFVPVSEEDGVVSVTGAAWFVSLLKRVDNLSVRSELCQEDWGVVVFANRADKRFWIGLSLWPEDQPAWLAHFHHHSFAWLQRWSTSGKRELDRLVNNFHSVLESESKVRDIAWYHEKDMRRANAPASSSPDVG